LDTLLITAEREDGLYNQHLKQCFSYLDRELELRQIMQKVVHSDRPLFFPSTALTRLIDLGLIKYNGNNVEPTNELYRSYFSQRL
jgi:AAA-like domain